MAFLKVNSYSEDIDFPHGTIVAKIMKRSFPGECANRVPCRFGFLPGPP